MKMKKQISILSVALTLLLGATSCNNEKGEPVATGEGGVKIKLGFSETGGTRAFSTTKPTTTWSQNIKSLKLVMVKTLDGKVSIVRDFPYTAGSNLTPTGVTAFTGIVAGTYDVYVIANLDQTGNVHGATGTANAQTIAVGDVFATKYYQLKTISPWVVGATGEATGSIGYGEPAEIFVASKSGVVIPNDGTTKDIGEINLTRIVSLLRVRIDKTDPVNAAGVDFSNCEVRLRRTGNAISFAGVPQVVNLNNTFASSKAFKDQAAFTALGAAKYSAGVMLTDTYTLWNDYIILPGGGTSTTNGFNIAISGQAPQNYKLADGTSVGAGGLKVWWQAAILVEAKANEILDVSIKITTPGTGGPGVPPANEYGGVSISVKPVDWGNITGVAIDI